MVMMIPIVDMVTLIAITLLPKYEPQGARDHLGGTAAAAVLGPWVRQPETLSTADLTNALAAQMQEQGCLRSMFGLAAYKYGFAHRRRNWDVKGVAVQQSSDPTKILSSLNAVTEMSGAVGDTDVESKKEVTNLALSALESVEATEESLQQLGDSVTKVVESSGTAADESALTRVKSVTSKLVSLISGLGQAAVKSLEPGELQEGEPINGSDPRQCRSYTYTLALCFYLDPFYYWVVLRSGYRVKLLSIPASAFAGRRLETSCDSMELQSTEWLKSNPHSYARSVAGASGTVPEDAAFSDLFADREGFAKCYATDVLNVELRYCGKTVLSVS
ncbi:Thermitase [Symbiodinium sp. CCMP2592]|nr:Thermitase [Symbiodinium sp. CCMP2592]